MEYNKKTLKDVNVDEKKIIVRVDFNVPIDKETGQITDQTRIVEALPTISYLVEKKAKVILLSHLGKIKSLEDITSGKKSLKVVYEALKNLLPGVEILFHESSKDLKIANVIKSMNNGSILLLENTRYNDIDDKGKVVKLESKNDPTLGKFWADLADVYVNDAFGTAHREHASNVGVANKCKDSCIGFLVEKELTKLGKAINNPEKPIVAIFGGAKISDKIKSIENIGKIADKILIGGGMSYTFFKAQGYEVGKSILEEESIPVAKELLEKFKDKLMLPIDINSSQEYADVKPTRFAFNEIPSDYEGLDIGKKTIKAYKKIIKSAKTIIWNGPLGVSEFENYAYGTNKICKAIAKATMKNGAYSIIGGGDSAAAAVKLGYKDKFSHISTGGGASLVFFEGVPLPGIAAIKDKK